MCLTGLFGASNLAAQQVRVSIPEENFRAEPLGTVLATVIEGTLLDVISVEASWSSVALEGWVWTPSLGSSSRDGFDLVVTKAGGENLRDTPNGSGRRAAILKRGLLLESLGREGNWTHVRRTAWMWSRSLRQTSGQTVGGPPTQRPPAESVQEAPAEKLRPSPAADRIVVGDAAIELLASPDGDTVAVASPGADLKVLSRRGNWARVRLDSWVWVPATLALDSVAPSDRLSAADLQANPQQFEGRTIQWAVQFVSLHEAEAVRTDFYEGEPFVLARAPDPEEGFVYLAVPPELLESVERLEPLQRINVVARVRTGRSALMGRPILDLIGLN